MASRSWDVLGIVVRFTTKLMRLLARRGRITSTPERPKKAIIIGINYELDPSNLLKFPQRDTKKVRKLLKETFGLRDEDIITLTDNEDENKTGRSLPPTRANIMQQVEQFIVRGQDNTDYFFFYSGHSAQHREHEPQSGMPAEEDGYRECLVPVDAKKYNEHEYLPISIIYDTYLHDKIIVPLEETRGSHLFALIDACHSCTLFNLKHHRCHRVGTITSAVRRVVRHYIVEDILVPIRGYLCRKQTTESTEPPNSTPNLPEVKRCKGICPRVPNSSQKSITICVSACKDSEVVYERDDSPTLTSAIVALLQTKSNATLKDVMYKARCVVDEVRQAARKEGSKRRTSNAKLKQANKALKRWNPQLSSNDPLDTNARLMYSDTNTYGLDRHGRLKRPVLEKLQDHISRTSFRRG